jgi:hypothetical protein
VVKNPYVQTQRILSYLIIGVAIAAFVLSLGFITSYYQLFYEGTDEMYSFYKDLQVVNKELFNVSLMLIVLSVLLIPFDISKKKPGIFGLIFVIVTTGYSILKGTGLISEFASYKNMYLAIDFSDLMDYKVSTFVFNFGSALFITLVILTSALTLVAIKNFISRLKDIKQKEVQNG